jgi:hypothetical protein
LRAARDFAVSISNGHSQSGYSAVSLVLPMLLT